jgi:hypothetical protein
MIGMGRTGSKILHDLFGASRTRGRCPLQLRAALRPPRAARGVLRPARFRRRGPPRDVRLLRHPQPARLHLRNPRPNAGGDRWRVSANRTLGDAQDAPDRLGPTYPDMAGHDQQASDHAAVFIDLTLLQQRPHQIGEAPGGDSLCHCLHPTVRLGDDLDAVAHPHSWPVRVASAHAEVPLCAC